MNVTSRTFNDFHHLQIPGFSKFCVVDARRIIILAVTFVPSITLFDL